MSRILAVLLFLAVALAASAEAHVLAVGSTVTYADGTVVTITDQEFVINRADMNAATIALKNAPVDAATILQLKTLSDGQQATIEADGKWKTIIGVGAFILGVVVDEASRSSRCYRRSRIPGTRRITMGDEEKAGGVGTEDNTTQVVPPPSPRGA